jgi:hypothetical protein
MQFRYINTKALEYQENNQPVISVDTKKKENIGNYCNDGKEYRPKGNPRKVKDHDFMDKQLGKVAPYGIYDISQNDGMVNPMSQILKYQYLITHLEQANGTK